MVAMANAEGTSKLETLTPTQLRVLNKVSTGLLNKQIAYEMGITEATVKAHVSAVLRKLAVGSRTQAAAQLRDITSRMRAT